MNKSIILSLSFLLFIIGGCKKEQSDPDPSDAPQLIAEKTAISPYEMTAITAENLTLAAIPYTGMMGGQEITFTLFENELIFMTPDIAAGAQTLTVTIDGKDYTIDYTVTTLPVITNPETYVAEKLTAVQYTDEELNAVKTRLQGKPGAEDISAQMDMIKTVYAEVQQAINNSTAEEKATLAKFMAANPDLFVKPELNMDYTGLELFKTTAGSDNIEQIAKDLNQAIQDHRQRIKKGLAVVLASALFGTPAVVTAGVLLAIIYVANSDLTDAVGNALDRVGNLITQDLFKTTGSPEFVSGTPYNLNIQSAYGNLNSQSTGSGSTVIQSIAHGYYSFEKSWNTFFNKFPKWLKGESIQLDKITEQKTKKIPVNPAYLSIENISNPDVTVQVDKANGKFAATFRSNQTTDQNFEYDIVYNCEGFERKSAHMTGKVLAASQDTLLKKLIEYGPWKDMEPLSDSSGQDYYEILHFSETTLKSTFELADGSPAPGKQPYTNCIEVEGDKLRIVDCSDRSKVNQEIRIVSVSSTQLALDIPEDGGIYYYTAYH